MNYNSDIKSVKEFGVAKSFLYNLVLSVFITLVISILAIWIFDLRLDIVLSDSMAPTFYEHDIVVIKQYDDYKVDEIIEFKLAGGQLATHRIIERHEENGTITFITKGDHNSKSDETEVPLSSVNGKVISIITNGEHIYNFFKSNYFMFIDLILGLWVLSATISGEIEMRKHNIAGV